MLSYKFTIFFSCMGYFVQAIVINFTPLLFNTFEKSYNISLSLISLLIAISFTTQFIIDILTARFSDKVNLRMLCIIAHICAAIGLLGFAILPDILPDPYLALVISTVIASAGSGFIEVIISPIVEACPTKRKSGMMSFLHSFYSWGLAGVVLLSTIFFHFFGIENWKILAALWAIIPAVGAVAFGLVPIYKLEGDQNAEEGKAKSLYKMPIFWVFLLIMLCAGAAEQAMSQWASSFAEGALGVSKTFGDLLGPFAFAIFMGSARIFYGLFSKKINLQAFMTVSTVLCIISYLLSAFAPWPIVSLMGCALCGLATGIMWPGTYSLAGKRLPYESVGMFAMLAFAGDLGCLVGPASAGFIADIFGDNLKVAFLFSVIFPLLMLVLLKITKTKKKNNEVSKL